MGKLFGNRKNGKRESLDSELAAFEEEFVSLDGETEPIEFDEAGYGDAEYEDPYGDYRSPADTVEEQEYYTEEIPQTEEYYTEEIPQTEGHYTEEIPRTEEFYTEEIPQTEGFYTEEIPQTEGFYTEEIPQTEEFYTEEIPQTEGFYTEEIPRDAGYYTEEIPQDTASADFADEFDTSRFGETAELGYDTASLDYTAPLNTDTAELQFDEVRFDTASLDIIEISKHTRNGERRRKRLPSEDEMVDLDKPVDREEEDSSGIRDKLLKIAIVLAACLALGILGFGIWKIKSRTPAGVSRVTYNEAGLPVSQEMIGSGNQIGGIDQIGGHGLLAALDARKAALMAAPEVHNDYNETQIVSTTKVAIELITVKSDLKIKFVNAETGKLLPNIPFTVTVTDPSGNSLSWADDDLDGIIYKTDLKEGKYTVRVEQLTGDKYSGYTWPSSDSINVKSTIDYARVDVNGEVKDASQVNESAEDTSGRGNGEGEDLTNTVTFVDSSTSPIYTEVAKSTITNPLAALTTGGGDWVILTAEDVSGNTDVSGNSGTDVSNNGSGGGSEQPKPAEKPEIKLTLSPASLSLKSGATGTFTISAELKVADKYTLEVKSSNESVAKCSVSGNTVTVTAVAGGSCDITVKATTEKNDKTTETASTEAKCSVTVTNVDMTQVLKDNSGNEVYVYENGAYRKATFADYAKFDKFYIITGTKYTGWQTLNGATYFYDSNGKPVTGTQVIQGVTYQFGADGKMTSTSGILGIDVSKWQGSIDWNAVKNSGVDYVIIRVGYRGSSAGALIDDSKFVANINGAKGAGLKVGVYFVTQAINDVEAVYEASMVLDRIKGYNLDLPVFLDVEASGGRGDTIDKNTRTAVIIAFCETIRSAGYTAGIYANKTWLSTKMDVSKFGNYKIWVAHYSSVCGYTGRYDYWQYTEKGTVSGINGYVDMDLRYT